jgi:malate dehydrogenase (oxaloacetate-decarboxylating)
VGLLTDDRADLDPEQHRFAQARAAVDAWNLGRGTRPGLAEVVDNVQPTVLIGLSSAPGAFSEEIVARMAARVERPIVLPLSNPTSRSEADPADLVRWTDGRVLTATGSPYPPVVIDGTPVPVAQSNNVFVFPAIGLGVIASGATRVTDAMVLAAANALGRCSPALRTARAPLLPPISELRGTAARVALAVASAAVAEGVAPEADEDELRGRVRRAQWVPAYDAAEPDADGA